MTTSIRIAFDETHNEGGRLQTTYSKLKEILEKEGFNCFSIIDFPIVLKKLQEFNILVIAGPDLSKFRPTEIQDIIKYVDTGGGLLIMSDAGGDRGHMTNLNNIASAFGIRFNNNQVTDSRHNLGIDTVPVITDFKNHEISKDLTKICYRAGCSLSTSGNAFPIAFSNRIANPQSAPIIAMTEYGLGAVVAIGTYEMFRTEGLGGIETPQNTQLALNIFHWLAKIPEAIPVVTAEVISEKPTVKQEEVPVASETDPETPAPSMRDLIPSIVEQVKAHSSSITELESLPGEIKKIRNAQGELKAILKDYDGQLDAFKSMRSQMDVINEKITKAAPISEIKNLNEVLNRIREEVGTSLKISEEKSEKMLALGIKIDSLSERVQTLEDSLSQMDKKISELESKVAKPRRRTRKKKQASES
ncbi:MAG: hypothetical protein ACFE7E_00255 [Candidatus Hodarchaeota archaeon]